MSPIRTFELYHGGAIVKLLRSDKPISLRMIETRPSESWSTYTLNDEVDLFVTYSQSCREIARSGGGRSWSFTFSTKQLEQLNKPNDHEVYMALVCAKAEDVEVCFLKPDEIHQIIDFSMESQSVTVRLPHRGQFRVFRDRRSLFCVPRSRLEKWSVPGS